MLSRRHVPLVLVTLGVGLLLNPVYLFPGGVPAEQTYTLEAEQPDDLDRALLWGDLRGEILHCASGDGPHQNRLCALESRVGPNGTLAFENGTLSDGVVDDAGETARMGYPYRFLHYGQESGFYEPRVRDAGDGFALSLAPVSPRYVAENLSITPYGAAPDPVRRAIDAGNATTSVRVPPNGPFSTDRTEELDAYVGTTGELVVRDGTYYHVTAGKAFDRWFPPLALTVARIVLVALGLLSIGRGLRVQRGLAGVEE